MKKNEEKYLIWLLWKIHCEFFHFVFFSVVWGEKFRCFSLTIFIQKMKCHKNFTSRWTLKKIFRFLFFHCRPWTIMKIILKMDFSLCKLDVIKKRYMSLGLWTSFWTLKKPSLIRFCWFKALFALWKENWIGNWHTFSSFSF